MIKERVPSALAKTSVLKVTSWWLWLALLLDFRFGSLGLCSLRICRQVVIRTA